MLSEVLKFLNLRNPECLSIAMLMEEHITVTDVEEIVRNLPESVFCKDMNDCLPIHNALISGQSDEVIRKLVVLYPEGLRVQNHAKRLPIHIACTYNRSLEVIKLLIDGYEGGLLVRDEFESLPIHTLCDSRLSSDEVNINFEISHYITLKCPQCLQCKNICGFLPIHYACSRNRHIQLIQHFVSIYPESLLIPTLEGDLPLHLSCLAGISETSVFLSFKNPEALSYKNFNDLTPLYRTLSRPHILNSQSLLSLLSRVIQLNPSALFIRGPKSSMDLLDLSKAQTKEVYRIVLCHAFSNQCINERTGYLQESIENEQRLLRHRNMYHSMNWNAREGTVLLISKIIN